VPPICLSWSLLDLVWPCPKVIEMSMNCAAEVVEETVSPKSLLMQTLVSESM